MVEWKPEYEDIKHRLMVVKESERYDADSKQSTAGFEGATNITVDSASIILQEKKNRNENDTGEMNRSKYMNKSKQMENASKKKKNREKIYWTNYKQKTPSKLLYLN